MRRHFGISALEARNVLPAWELDLLLDGLAHEEAGLDREPDDTVSRPLGPPPDDPFAAVPEGLRKMKQRR